MIVVLIFILIIGIPLFFAFLADGLDSIIPAIITMFLLIIIFFGGINIINSHCPEADIITPIYSINNFELTGDYTYIFLLEGKDSYKIVNYWIKENNAFTQKNARLDNSTFVEDDKSFLRITGKKCDNSFITFGYQDMAKYEFHIPEGSLIKMYEAENETN